MRQTTVGSAGRRLSTITVDQVLAGAANILVALLAAHLLGTAGFGLFGLVFILFIVAQGASRALVGEAVLVHPEDARNRPGAPITARLLLGAVIGAVVATAGVGLRLAGVPLGTELILLGAALPLLGLHDIGRYLAFAVQRPGLALVLDVAWLLLLLGGVAAIVALGARDLVWFIAVWLGSGCLAAGLVPLQHRVRLGGGLAWLRERWSFSGRYLASFVATQGAVLVFSATVAAAAGAYALGAIRGATFLVSPFNAFQTAAVAFGTAELANSSSPRDAGGYCRRITALTCSIAAVNIAVLLLTPDALGRLVLADTWDATKELLYPACVQILCTALVAAPRSFLNGTKNIRIVVRVDIATIAVVFLVGTIVVVLTDALTAYWGVVGAQAASAAAWWVVLRRHLRSGR